MPGPFRKVCVHNNAQDMTKRRYAIRGPDSREYVPYGGYLSQRGRWGLLQTAPGWDEATAERIEELMNEAYRLGQQEGA